MTKHFGVRRRRRTSPLPDREGVPPARLYLPPDGVWPTAADFLVERTRNAAGVRERLSAGEVLLGDGTVVHPGAPYRPGEWVYLYRDLPDETPVPGEITVLLADTDIVVVDKPHFLATMPRGQHVAQTALVRLRRQLGLPDLAPAHRLDRLTAGVLLFTVRPEVRGAYQELFARREVAKTYLALAPIRDDLVLPTVVSSRIVKRRGRLQATEEPGEPNAVTQVELLRRQRIHGEEVGLYRLTPRTGRTHQLRVHLAGLGIPILNDPLYPADPPVSDAGAGEARRHDVAGPGRGARSEQSSTIPPEDFTNPLRLLAYRLAFTDPISGEQRCFTSRRSLDTIG